MHEAGGDPGQDPTSPPGAAEAPRAAVPAAPERAEPVSPCLAAVEQADAVISYLVGGVRDARLESALQRYVATAHGCRKEQS
jgi:hypothetical protein